MSNSAAPSQLASQARRLYSEQVVKGLTPLVQAALDGARALFDKPSEHAVLQRRRDLVHGLTGAAQGWHKGMVGGLRHVLLNGVSASRAVELPQAGAATLSLVDDDTIELEIVTSRLALAIMDRASWEFADLRSRIAHLERRAELDPHDMLRAHVLARIVFDAWRAAGLTLENWRELQPVLHDEFALLVEEAYHETNRWLADHDVLPEVDLRPFIRRQRSPPGAAAAGGWGDGGWGEGGGVAGRGAPSAYGGRPSSGRAGGVPSTGGYGTRSGTLDRGGFGGRSAGGVGAIPGGGASAGAGARAVGDETRMMTRAAPLARNRDQADAVLGRLNRLVARHVPEFGVPTRATAISPALSRAIDTAQQGIRKRLAPTTQRGAPLVTEPVMLEELHQRRQLLKRAAATPEERATVEIVALLFQSILTEERIPASVRVWFARLQMPVLRVALAEPDFFATVDHPARRLIDRMGACVMGFDSAASAGVGDALEKEIKRVVQVVEAYPDTGRRVFQTVLVEFEKFLEHYFRNENETTRKGVSLAQQVEQRETLAIQYTIELRRMLAGVPVQEGVRQFLFHVWADVLATTAVRFGAQGETTKTMKRAAADLIWSASAKVTREERAEVIRRLPPLLKSLREGMGSAGIDAAKQDEQIQQLNNSLAAAFTAKAAVIPDDRLRELMERLETLEELLPEAEEVEIDESMVLDLSGHQSDELEVVLEGGSAPTPAMLAWARELQVGSWYMLESHGRSEPVQLAWQGLRKQLTLFVSPQGRCVLFQQHRLASYLQAGMLLPAQDEALTVRATRSALAKLDVDASRLLA
jgi:antitoxin component of MazEF toxin-antitoxin module